MTTNVQGWTTLAENPLVLVREYSFGVGTANAMVVGLPNGPGQDRTHRSAAATARRQGQAIPVAGDKLGDVLVRVDTEKGKLLYAGDFIANIRELPKKLLFRLMFKVTDSGPGFKVFRIFFKMFVADRRAARDALIREVESNPPAVLVPAHGEVVTRSDLGPTLVSMLRAAVS